MTIDVQLTWPGLAEALKEYECREVRCPQFNETFLSHSGAIEIWENIVIPANSPRPILTPRWRFPSDKLPGAVCISHEAGAWVVWIVKPSLVNGVPCESSPEGTNGFTVIGMQSNFWKGIGCNPPTPTGDPAKDIWLNPDHPANKGE